MTNEICNCGRPTRYTHGKDEDGNFLSSCNKYAMCPTYEDLSNQLLENRKFLFELKQICYDRKLNDHSVICLVIDELGKELGYD